MNGCVFVLGSINIDSIVSVRRLPAPGETLIGESLTRQLGGKGANQAVAVSRAGSSTVLLGMIGDEANGAGLLTALACQGINVSAVMRTTKAPTGQALIISSPSENQIVVVPGANALVDETVLAGSSITAGDVCLAQMETPVTVVLSLFRRARTARARTILNAAPASSAVRTLLPLVDILVLNQGEMEALAGGCAVDAQDDAVLLAVARKIALPFGIIVVITLGPDGVVVIKDEKLQRFPARVVNVVDTTGAGDCFCGYLAAGLLRGDNLETAVGEANLAASVAVQAPGAASSIPARSELLPETAAAPLEG